MWLATAGDIQEEFLLNFWASGLRGFVAERRAKKPAAAAAAAAADSEIVRAIPGGVQQQQQQQVRLLFQATLPRRPLATAAT